ncbi:MAG: hypothetical protein ACTHW1_05430 [Ancrocorticia sp.]|uniref:hypothetical protein n=1 Tax=Ancrocorticia sp. TaxID=2593684 RepID=UPI003F8F64B0
MSRASMRAGGSISAVAALALSTMGLAALPATADEPTEPPTEAPITAPATPTEAPAEDAKDAELSDDTTAEESESADDESKSSDK